MAITESDPIVTGLGEHIFNPAPAPPPLVLMPVERLYPQIVTIGTVGKPRPAMTPGIAVLATIVNVALIGLVVWSVTA